MPDNTVPLAEARATLSTLVKRVHAGEEFTITVSGLPIARLSSATTSTSVQTDLNFGVDAVGPTHRKPEATLPLAAEIEDDVPL